jgi:formylglycine-generating enzyme required for sulfatase activity
MRRLGILAALLITACAGPSAVRPCPVCPELLAVPGQSWRMGRTEVTFDQWQACVADGTCRPIAEDHGWGRASRPAINITWDQAVDFTRWMSRKSGQSCRLPSEAEWEWAARAGSKTAYWWGDLPEKGRANCRDCLDEIPHATLPVGSFDPNPWGFADMNGNVWEWTADCWLENQPKDSCAKKIIKGGSWYHHSPNATAWARAGNDRSAWSYAVGLRVLCETASR